MYILYAYICAYALGLGVIAAIVDGMHLPYLKHAVETVRERSFCSVSI